MPSRRPAAACLAALAAVAAGCGAAPHRSASPGNPPTSSPEHAAGAAPASTSGAAAPATTTTTTVRPATTTTTLPRDQPGWSVVAETPRRILTDTRTLTEADGDRVTLLRFHAGTYRLDLHLGSEDPPSAGLAIPAAAGDAVDGAERPLLLGAFNGGFKAATNPGGVEVDGLTVTHLVAGDASLVIDRSGAVHIGVWGQGLPARGEKVLSVRQNLQPLIHDGRVSPAVGVVGDWGATLGGGNVVARSAVGVDAAGDLIYAGSMACVPGDLASALKAAGATQAMELDINPYWIQGDVTRRPGGPLRAAIPGQQRPAGTYLSGWTRDFFVVVAAPGVAGRR
jgi:hypothetical protein